MRELRVTRDSLLSGVGGVGWDTSVDMLAVASRDGYLAEANSSWERVLGYSPAKLTSRPYLDFVHPDDVATTVQAWQALREPGPVTIDFDNRLRGKDGSYRSLAWNVRSTEDGEELYCVVRDVTEHVLARQARADIEHRYRLLSANTTDAVYLADLTGEVTWVSPATRDVLGYDPDDLLGTNPLELIHPDDLPQARALRASIGQGEPGVRFEIQVRTATGPYRWMSGAGTRALDADGTVVGEVVSLRDVHEQVLARQALVDSERRYRLLAENATDIVCQVDADNVRLWVSQSVQSVLGWRPAQLLRTSPGEIVHPDDLEAMTMRRVELSTTAAPALELRVRAACGTCWND